MKKLYPTIILILSTFLLLANDSLEDLLKTSQGSRRAELLIQLSYTHFAESKNKGFSTVYEALLLSENEANAVLVGKAENTLAVLHQRSSNFDSALFYYGKAIEHLKDPEAIAGSFNNMGTIYKQLAKYDSALYFHHSARKLQATTGDKKGVAVSYNNIGSVYLNKRDFDKALEFYEKSLKLREELHLQSAVAASCLNIGRVYSQWNKYADAQKYFEKALALREELGDQKLIAYTLNSIGNFYLQLKIYDKARENYNKALHINETIGDNAGRAAALNNIGTVHRELENYTKALEYYMEALRIREKEGLTAAQAYSLNNIGGLYWHKKDYKAATDFYNEARIIWQDMGNNIQVAHSYKNLGMVNKDKAQYPEALMWYEKALEAFLEESDLEAIASIQNLKGNLYRKTREYAKAYEFYTNALEIYKQVENDRGVAYTNNNIGITYVEWGKPQLAVHHFKTAITKAIDIREKYLEKDASLALAQLFKAARNYKESLKYFEMHSVLKDSLLANESSKRIAEIEFENDLMVKDHQIAQQNTELEKQENKISEQRTLLTVFIIVFIIISILIGFALKQYKGKQKALVEIKAQKENIEQQHIKLDVANKELKKANRKVEDSIRYAKKIQDAILPSDTSLQSIFEQSFVFYEPRDIVSGDFYWLHQQDNKIFLAVADCTGHGVPGAFMSMIGNTLLNEIVLGKKMVDPAQIITEMDKGVITALRQNQEQEDKQEDGMEMSLCVIDMEQQLIEFAGTDQKMYIAKGNSVEGISGNIFPIGGMYSLKQRKNIPYKKQSLPIEKGMTLYLLSDGFVDQFGGPEDQRYSSGQLTKLIAENQQLDMAEQFLMFRREFEGWKKQSRQIDDVLVLGLRF